MLDNAQKVFDEMPQRNCGRTMLSFNVLLGACVNSNKFDMVEKIFGDVPEKLSIEPDLVSYNTVIEASCKMDSFDCTVSVIELMDKKGVKPNVITFNTILDCLYGSKRFSDAEKIWGQMAKKNVVPDIRSYNAKLLGLALEKRSEEGAQLVEELRSIGMSVTWMNLSGGMVKQRRVVVLRINVLSKCLLPLFVRRVMWSLLLSSARTFSKGATLCVRHCCSLWWMVWSRPP
ncbi:putative pentatricopeptide [Rosa chinensis]|uniref:Putative pentatricopeptide n=1 Tax=Rosa chinensis TaxID=74649 RepID=A0A2P6Q346_ROSCH|nr:putative pentatricopeptide [Rosa chinensis]